MLKINNPITSIEEVPSNEFNVNHINSISKKYKSIRQLSKSPTFALAYGGSYLTLMNNNGFVESTAKKIEANYHKLYAISDQWVAGKLAEATDTGYVTCAFGLRLRTPILQQSYCKAHYTPFIALSEQRSAGNAVSGQSYGLLTTRAGIEFQNRCLASKHKLDIMPAAQIHDALYFLVRDNAETVKWLNDNLIDCMRWQNLPELQHDKIKITSGLELYWPDWSNGINVPNNVETLELKQIALKAKKDYHDC